MEAAVVLLAIAALGGLVMAGIRLKGAPRPPTWLAMLHGVLAAAALTLLIYAWFTVGLPPMASLGLLLLLGAALGGAILNLGYHWRKLPLPVPLMLGHGATAAAGFVLVLLAVLQTRGVTT